MYCILYTVRYSIALYSRVQHGVYSECIAFDEAEEGQDEEHRATCQARNFPLEYSMGCSELLG